MSSTGLVIKPMGQIAAALQQLYQRPPDTIRGLKPENWPSPLQPVAPIGPPGAEPLGIPFFHGQNLNYTPRFDLIYTAAQLQQFSMYPLARMCIENQKDAILRTRREIQLKPQQGEKKKDRDKRAKGDQTLKKLNALFDRPNPEQNWDEWLRPILEDMFVIDAASILLRKTFKGEVAELRRVPGASIVRYIDQNGYTPQPPSPAYAQLWEGIPRVNLTTDDLIYKPRNIVYRQFYASYLYGMSPTEQAIEEIKIGIERLKFILSYYTEGSVPACIMIVPPGNTDPAKIEEAQSMMNSELAGNLARKRQIRLIQGFNKDKPDQVLFPKEPLLADLFDEVHTRKICFLYGTSPQRLNKTMNRSSATANQSAAEEEGLLPWLDFVKILCDEIIQRKIGATEYEIDFDAGRDLDQLKQSQADMNDVDNGIRPINEVREDRGLDPVPQPWANLCGFKTATGFLPLGETPPNVGGASGIPGKPSKPGQGNSGGQGKGPGGAGNVKPNGKSLWAACAKHAGSYSRTYCHECNRAEIARQVGQTEAAQEERA